MNRYHIRIDGEQSADSYTYQELVDLGLFELDAENLNGIEVKKTTNKVFKPFKSFCFPERSYYVDEFGQIHRGNKTSSSGNEGVDVDVYGQIVRPNSSTSTGSSNSSSSTPSSSSSGSTSNSDDWDLFWRIIGTILVLAIGIPILINIGLEGFWGYAVFIVGGWILSSIWD